MSDSTQDIKINEFPIIEKQEVRNLTPTYKDLVESAISALIDPEVRGLIITGSSYSGKSFVRDAVLSLWDEYSSKVNSSKSKTLFARVSNFTKIKGIQAMKDNVESLKEYASDNGYTNVCMLVDEAMSAHVLSDMGVNYILEVDSRELEEFSLKITRKIPDVYLIDMDMVHLSRLELVESILTRRDYEDKSSHIKITKRTVENFLDELDLILDERYSTSSEGISAGISAYIFNKMIFYFLIKEKKATKASIIDYLSTTGEKQLHDLMSQYLIDYNDDVSDSLIGEVKDALQEMGMNFSSKNSEDKKSPGIEEQRTIKNPDLIKEELSKVVIGQDKALELVRKSLLLPAAQIKLPDDRGPISTLFFLGPTGVGKTETARSLAKNLYEEGEVPLLQIDLSEYSESHEAQKLYGAPAGYLGYQDGGILTNLVRDNPRCVLLLDEAEKAHPSLWDKFLQVFEDGRMTDNSGKVIDFSQAVIIMTSNLGAYEANKTSVGFGSSSSEADKENIFMSQVKKKFRPEFINRIDSFIVFNSIDKDNGKKIVQKNIENFSSVLDSKGISIHGVDDEVSNYILDMSDFSSMGGRNIKRKVKELIVSPIAELMIENKDIESINVSIANNKEGLQTLDIIGVNM